MHSSWAWNRCFTLTPNQFSKKCKSIFPHPSNLKVVVDVIEPGCTNASTHMSAEVSNYLWSLPLHGPSKKMPLTMPPWKSWFIFHLSTFVPIKIKKGERHIASLKKRHGTIASLNGYHGPYKLSVGYLRTRGQQHKGFLKGSFISQATKCERTSARHGWMWTPHPSILVHSQLENSAQVDTVWGETNAHGISTNAGAVKFSLTITSNLVHVYVPPGLLRWRTLNPCKTEFVRTANLCFRNHLQELILSLQRFFFPLQPWVQNEQEIKV